MTDVEQHEKRVEQARILAERVHANVETLGWIDALKLVIRAPSDAEIDEASLSGNWNPIVEAMAYGHVNDQAHRRQKPQEGNA